MSNFEIPIDNDNPFDFDIPLEYDEVLDKDGIEANKEKSVLKSIEEPQEEVDEVIDGYVVFEDEEKPIVNQPHSNFCKIKEKTAILIRQSARKMSFESIVKLTGEPRQLVYKYMVKNHLLHEDEVRNQGIKQSIIEELHSYAFWPTLERSYTDEELYFFEEEWYSSIIQFEDNVQATERVQLRQAIELQIRNNRLVVDEKDARDQIDELNTTKELYRSHLERFIEEGNEEEADLLRAKISGITTDIFAIKQGIQSIPTDIQKNTATMGKLFDQLKATREKRLEKIEVSNRTWPKMLQEIEENPRLKQQMSAVAYLSFIAVESVKAQLKKKYKFADGDEHPLILSSDEETDDSGLGDMVKLLYAPKIKETKNDKKEA